MIGGVQIGEVDAVKGFDVARDRLGVIQRGGDQVVQVDRLDVEGLPHVGTAVAQDLHDFGPILHRVEMGFDRLGRSRDFAQRQRNGKKLGQNYFHRTRTIQ